MNAASRLGCARLLVELLTTSAADKAQTLARNLEDLNTKRQVIERRIQAEAREMAAESDPAATPAYVLAQADWQLGVIGIVAGRLADQLARPVLLVAQGAGRDDAAVWQGSGRSVPGFALHDALRACADHLVSHGGHRAAAGFKIRPDALDAFRECFVRYAAEHFAEELPVPRLVLDAEVPLSAVTTGLVQDLDRLEPYGMENPRPVLLAGGLQITGEPKKMGKGERHLSFQVRQNGASLRAVAFGMADRVEELMSADGQVCLAFTPKINEWQGWRKAELEVADFQAGPRARLE
jgi:single-stranded-DNA-specific exonuclease